MQLKDQILELLQDHECVIVPEFGGFILNPESARYDQLQHKFYPPSKRVSFNRNLTKNDGLLAQAISNQVGTSYNEALLLIAKEKDQWKEVLKKEGVLNLSGLGFFKQSKSDILSFEPDSQAAFGLDSFGLEPFHALPLQKEDEQTEEQQIIGKTSSVLPIEESSSVSKRKTRRKWGYVAAGIIAAPVLGYAAWLASSSGVFQADQRFHYSDLNPFSEKVCEVYFPNSSEYSFQSIVEESPFSLPELNNIQSPTAEIKFIENEDGAVIVRLSDKTVVVPSKTSNEKPVAIKGSYHVIAGCFSVKSNADQLAKQLQEKGYNAARILDKDGRLYRVTAGTFENKLDAKVALRDFKALENNGAWITKK